MKKEELKETLINAGFKPEDIKEENLNKIFNDVNNKYINPLMNDKKKEIEEEKAKLAKSDLEKASLEEKINLLSQQMKETQEKAIATEENSFIKSINSKLDEKIIGQIKLLAKNEMKSDEKLTFNDAVNKIMEQFKLKGQTSFAFTPSNTSINNPTNKQDAKEVYGKLFKSYINKNENK